MKVELKKLKSDKYLLKMRPLDQCVVSRYRQSLRNGDIFPAFIVDKKTMKVVSGNHTLAAMRQEFPLKTMVEVELRDFPSKADLLTVFAERNIANGHPLSGFSRKLITAEMIRLKMSIADIAKALHMPEERIQIIGDQVVTVIGSTANGLKYYKDLPVKRGLENIYGKEITQAQYDTHCKKDVGMTAVKMACQLIRWLHNGWVDNSKPAVRETMTKLKSKLDENGF